MTGIRGTTVRPSAAEPPSFALPAAPTKEALQLRLVEADSDRGPAKQIPKTSAQSGHARQNRTYPPPVELPTQEGPHGLHFDFNSGCRVKLPESKTPWRVRLCDVTTGNILFDIETESGWVRSTKRYFIRFRLEVWRGRDQVFIHACPPSSTRRPRKHGGGAIRARSSASSMLIRATHWPRRLRVSAGR